MNWNAVIPFKGVAEHKTRLSVLLSADVRRLFAQSCLHHVAQVLRDAGVDRVFLLCDRRPACWHGPILHDHGAGLNAELDRLTTHFARQPMLVIHADLPLLTPRDVTALTDAAAGRPAIAPDRHECGTNALALPDPSGFRFAFGANSLLAHVRAAPGAGIVRSAGLGFDIDTPGDLAELTGGAAGHRLMPIQA